LRVSLAAVKAMALGWGKKAVCGLASLDIIAHGVNKDGRISVILDARRGNVYAADYDNRAGRILRIGSYRLVSFERWLKDIFVTASRQKIFVAGDGLRIYADRLYGRDNIVCLSEKYWFPRPEEFLSLAGEDIACRQDFIRNVAAITPIYLYSKECQIK
ncbi:MAG: tRNA threonylcarbamoyladenosine biosynthesis protein TsaB, partial [Candidatus Omnitrophota bacterium]